MGKVLYNLYYWKVFGMYLKEIKLSGFKSFADKTSINLDDNITCIVGPNGSGKSNIVDAVKWVLGEQSIKSLRGNNGMTDVIFSGSKSRSPLNIASVTLIFDNSDSYIKVPYSEISITRKVYKTGENEYYLNEEKCRLKDIQDLFLDIGMGKAAYNIISQGEIAKIISDSPYDRRIIFEEVAGVLKYRKRKEEALKKLEKTNDNLSRVKDIINELEKQLDPLKEESDKAQEYLENKEKLEAIEVSLIVHDIEDLNSGYSEEKTKKEKIENEIIETSTTTTNSDIGIIDKKNKLGEINNNLFNLNNKLLILTKEEEKLNGEKNIIQERSKYNAEDQRLYENISNLKENKLRYESDIDSIKKEILILEKEKSGYLNKKEIKENEISLIKVDKDKFNIEIVDKKRKIIDLSYKIQTLNDYIENGGNINPNVKRLINNPKLNGIHNTIINLINVDKEYLTALEVALGGAKDYVVVDTSLIAKSCINYLKENNLGRVTFFPIDVIKPRAIDEETLKLIRNENGYINILSKLINYDSKYENIIKNQLGNVILVNDIDTANYIAKLINYRYKIVTLTGEIVNVGGSITGGVIKISRSIISDKYEYDELLKTEKEIKTELVILEEKLTAIENNINILSSDILLLEKEIIKLNEAINIKNSSKNLINEKYSLILNELKDLDNIINNTLSIEEENILNKYYEVVNEKNNVVKEIGLFNKNKDDLLIEIDKLEANYKENNVIIRKLEANLKDLEIDINKKELKIDNLLTILNESYSLTFEKAKMNYILDMDEKEARKEVNTYRSNLKKIGIVNLGSISEYERISKRYDFLTNQKEDLEKAIEALLNIINSLDKVMTQEFVKSFKEIKKEFDIVFKDLFKGGSASLNLDEEENILDCGIDIIVSPPGKKLSSISLLSGGEKALTAICLLFAILNVKKVPFCLFDEVESPLDEANVDMFGTYLNKYRKTTQFLIITHKKRTMTFADSLYGITMQESGVSKLVSVKLVN